MTALPAGPASAHRRLLGRSALAAAIKLVGAALAFAMFIALAWSMDAVAFGQFSTAFAAASVVSFFTPVGQQSAVLRFWPQLIGDDAASAHALLRRSSMLVALASLAGGGIVLLSGPWLAATDWAPLVVPTALLAIALGWTEFTSAVFRARQRVPLALLPRDVVWRSAVLATASAVAVAGGVLTPAQGVWACGAFLLLATLPQTVLLLRDLASHRHARATAEPLAQHRAALGGLWGVTALVPALNQAGTLLVAASVGPEAAGALFAAERMARLIEVVQEGINQGTAPSVSTAFRQGGREVQMLAGLTALACTLAALGAIAVALLFGDRLLAVFNPAYATPLGVAVLVIFCVGTGVDALLGPSGLVLQMAGAQDALLRIVLIVYPLGLGALAAMTFAFGPLGAALGTAGTVAAQAIAAWVAAHRQLGIDTSIFGLIPPRQAARV